MQGRRVVITGLGAVTPLGNTVDETWSGIVAGNSGIGPITDFDVSAFSTQFGGSVRDFDVSPYMPPKEARRYDPFIHYGMAAAVQALQDSGLQITDANAERVGTFMSAGIGGIGTIESARHTFEKSGPRKIGPFVVAGSIINMISGQLSIHHGLKGPNLAVVTACTTGTHSIGLAARAIAYGDADAVIAGGAECATTPVGLGGFAAARALSTRNDDPQAASRPWDRDRDGFVLSDGAGALMLEEMESARARGANILAEVTGFGMSGDAHHVTAPPADGDGAYRAMANAMRDAQLDADDVHYINAHGTSTPAGDVAESRAIERLLGSAANKVVVSSTKSMIGHLLGAAGAVEAIFSVLAIRDQVAPPTINLENPDEGCNLDYAAGASRDMKIQHAMSNSFGFGGTNGSLIFSRV